MSFFLWGKAFHRGFYCDDESLRHPYHDSTVPSYYLYIFGFGGNLIAVSIFADRSINVLNRPSKTFDANLLSAHELQTCANAPRSRKNYY